MTLTRMVAVAGFAALLGGAAYAGDDQMHKDMYGNLDPTPETTQVTPPVASTDSTVSAPSATSAAMPASTLAPDNAPGTVTTRLVTNGPVPDTPENRARFGGPMSRAGKMTSASGN